MKKNLLLTVFIFGLTLAATAQDSLKIVKAKPPIFSFKFGSGLGITTSDSLFSINFRFRVQSRVGYVSMSDRDLTPEEFNFLVRRMRLRIGGFIYTPRLTYNVQLSFSRADMDWDVSQVPNVLRDAMIAYETKQGLTFAIGQGKLPGNRQRVISSGELQFADRSIVNAALTLDRDFGVFVNYANHIKDFHFLIKTALSSGEGRNYLKSDKGLAYTARLEFLPLGKFTDKGDYFEGDLVREQKPKLSLSGTVHYNHLAQRTGGQLGYLLYAPRNLTSAIGEVLFKYKGIALSSEFLYRSTDSSKTYNNKGEMRHVYTGYGVNTQLSYCFKNRFEIALRHSLLTPSVQIRDIEKQKSDYAIAFSKYFLNHRLKLQTDLTYQRQRDLVKQINHHNNFQWRFQIELGI